MNESRELYLVRDFGPVAVDAARSRASLPLVDARVLGWLRDDGFWEGFVEFVDSNGTVVVTPAETSQATLADLVRWAADLTPIYLSGALYRAERGLAVRDEEPRAGTSTHT